MRTILIPQTHKNTMKKKLILMLLIAFCSVLAMEAKTYEVYMINGKVSHIINNNWVSLSKSDNISEAERIKINPSSQLKLLDRNTHQVYSFSEQGEWLISDLFKKASKENGSLIGKINSEVEKQLTSSKKSHREIGASKRETTDDERIEALYTAVFNNLNCNINQGPLKGVKIKDDDELFHLELSNDSEEIIYTTVFIQTEEANWSALNIDDKTTLQIILAPQSTIQLDNIQFAETDELKLAIIGFDSEFDVEELNYMLKSEYEPQDEGASDIYIYHID